MTPYRFFKSARLLLSQPGSFAPRFCFARVSSRTRMRGEEGRATATFPAPQASLTQSTSNSRTAELKITTPIRTARNPSKPTGSRACCSRLSAQIPAQCLFGALFAAKHDDPEKQDREHGANYSNCRTVHRSFSFPDKNVFGLTRPNL